MKSRIYEGIVQHDRRLPRRHRFSYRVCQLYLDLDELPTLFDRHWFWSARRPALAHFERRDHLGAPQLPLRDAVCELVQRETGARSAGPIRLLTHPRYFGYGFNPVSFYYCFDAADQHLEFVVAEINNTPWREQHCYVFDCRDTTRTEHNTRLPDNTGHAGGIRPLADSDACNGSGPDPESDVPATTATKAAAHSWTFEFDKRFHVSPFMAMNQRYRWRLWAPGEQLRVHMQNIENEDVLFGASMQLCERPLDSRGLARALLRYPLMTAQVIGAIHWQALRLWLKGVPVHDHPRHLQSSEVKQ